MYGITFPSTSSRNHGREHVKANFAHAGTVLLRHRQAMALRRLDGERMRLPTEPKLGADSRARQFPSAPAVGAVVALAAVVSIIPIIQARFATFVALLASVPVMVVVHIPAIAFLATGVILSTVVVRLHAVRALIRRPRPVAVVPLVARSLRIPVPLDPLIIGSGSGGRRYAHGAGVRQCECRRKFVHGPPS
jgi:hypothetical protein